jgi:hypothetical protein
MRNKFHLIHSQNLAGLKAQGQSLKFVGLDFHQPEFTHGQFYVGVSYHDS